MSAPAFDESVPLTILQQVNRRCARFEQQWRSGERPSIDSHLQNEAASSQPVLLRELLLLDLEYRLAAGESPAAADYAHLNGHNDALFDAAIQRLQGRTTAHTPGDTSVDIHLTYPEQLAHRKLGRYTLAEQLGRGGFGAVWKAFDSELKRTVAVKLPRTADLTQEQVQRMEREARAAAQLEHPGIVKLHEIGREDGHVFLVSEYVNGLTLANWHEDQHLTNREAASMVRQIAEAVAHAHKCGVIHRDLKPQNVIVDEDGKPHLTDFGLARWATDEETITQESLVAGTPAYMSPEQARGDTKHADERSDIYSLGAMLYELLAGETPFRGDTLAVLRQIVDDEPTQPRKLNTRVHVDLQTIALKCLEKEPNKRYQSARQLADELQRFLNNEPIKARPLGRLEWAWRWGKRHRTVSATLITLLIASTISALFGLQARWESQRAYLAETQATQRSNDFERLAYASEGRYALEKNLLRDAYRDYEQAARIEPSWYFDLQMARIAEKSRSVWSLVDVHVFPFAIREAQFMPGDPTQVIALSESSRLLTVHVRGKEEQGEYIHLPAEAVQWLPVSEKSIAVVGKDAALRLYSLPDLELKKQIELSDSVHSIKASPSGEKIAVASSNGNVSVYLTDTLEVLGTRLFPLTHHRSYATTLSVDFSPSGKQLVVWSGVWTHRAQLWNLEANEVSVLPHVQQHWVKFFDEQRLMGVYSISEDSDMVDLHLYPADPTWEQAQKKTKYFTGNARGDAIAWLDSEEAATDSPASLEDDLFRAVVFGPDNVSTISGWTRADTTLFEYSALLPHLEQKPLAADVSEVGPSIVLVNDDQAFVFEKATEAPPPIEDSAEATTRFWSFAASRSAIFTATTRLSLDDNARFCRKRLDLPPVASSDGHQVLPWGMSVSPDERLLSVLWQENSGGGTISAKYYGKIVGVYEKEAESSSAVSYRLRNQLLLDDYQGTTGRESRGIAMTPDGSHITFCCHNMEATTYNAFNGEVLFRHPTCNTTAMGRYGRYLAHGYHDRAEPVRVVDLTQGTELFLTEDSGKVRTMCFDPAGERLYVGWDVEGEHRMDVYAVATGRRESFTLTAVSPVEIHPLYSDYVGFRPQSPVLGTTVLADVATGRLMQEMDRGTHVLGRCGFTGDGRMLVVPKRSSVTVYAGRSSEEVSSSLDTPLRPH